MNTTWGFVTSAMFNQSLNGMLGRKQMVPLFLCTAPIGLFANCLIMVTICLTKAIHNKSHFVILSYTIAAALYEVTMIIWEIRLAVRIQQRTPIIVPAWLCVLNYQQIGIASQGIATLSTALALDRFMCVATPIFYKKLDMRRYILVVNLVAYWFVIAGVLLGMIGKDIFVMWNCESATYQYNEFGLMLYNEIGSIAVGILGALYVSAAAILVYRYKKANLIGTSQKAEWKQRWEVQAFMSMSVVGMLAIVMRMAGGIPFTVAQDNKGVRGGSGVSGTVLVSLSVFLRFSESVLHFFVYLIIDSGFRAGFKKNILRRTVVQQISPASSGAGRGGRGI